MEKRIEMKIEVDSSSLDIALEKADRLITYLNEANQLLASMRIKAPEADIKSNRKNGTVIVLP